MMILGGVEFFNKKSIEILFEIFYNDFISNTTVLSDGNNVYQIDVKKDNVCDCPFGGIKKPERFWHIITKKIDNKTKRNNPCPSPENQRMYDSARAKRIHWIKPIIKSWLSDPDIVHFYEKINGRETLHIWHTKKDFLVIIRKESRRKRRFLVSTYLIHRNQRQRYKKRLKKYEDNKPLGFEWF